MNKAKSRIILALGLAWAVAPLSGQAQVVTLSEASGLMTANETELRILDLQDDIAAELSRQAFGQRLPRVNLKLEYIYTQQNIISQDNTTFERGRSNYPTMSAALTVSQPLFDAVRFRALPLAEAQQQLVAIQADGARTQINTMFTAAYLGVARAQAEVQRSRAVVTARAQLESDLTQMVAQGRAENDRLMRAQSDTLSARADLSGAELNMADALFELQRFTGVGVEGVRYGAAGVSTVAALRASFPVEQLENLNPGIQIAKAEVAVAEMELAQLRGAYLPTADLTLEHSYRETEGSLFGGGSTVSSTELGVQVNWSIYAGGVNQSRIREGERRLEIAQLRLNQSRDLAQRRYRALMESMGNSMGVINAMGQDQRVAAERYQAAEAQLAAGQSTSERVIDARLRSEAMGHMAQVARIRAVQIQSEIYALFGALDIEALSRDFVRS